MDQFFDFKFLKKLHKKGQLKSICTQFAPYINKKNFLSANRDSSSFLYEDQTTLKICTKKLPFFKQYNTQKFKVLSQFPKILSQTRLHKRRTMAARFDGGPGRYLWPGVRFLLSQ